MHSLLRHLEGVGFSAAPRALGFDDQGREMLSYLSGEVVGTARPWPGWVHSDDALCQVACWLRDFHAAVAGFEPPPAAIWRERGAWRPGLIVGHNDAAPYNVAWADGRLVGFFDSDFAAPVTPEWDLAFTAFAWGTTARPARRGSRRLHRIRGQAATTEALPGCLRLDRPDRPVHRDPQATRERIR